MAPPTKFGPKLDFYLATCRERAPLDHAPDKEEIIRAIASLADPLSVSYTTFETILALERAPLCAHASILLTGSHILPSCIQLLRQYCSGRTQLFDHAYGYLCFQLMNLSIEVAKLARVNVLPKFLHILKSSSRGIRDKAITEELAVHVREWEAKEFTPGGQFLLPASNLLGWGIDPPTRMPTALPGIGGFTILDTVFLMEKIWESRGKFLRCLRSALRLQNYAGWCGIFHLMHDTLVRMHGMSHINGQEFDEYQNWITFTDIMQRYSLCANHYEEPTVSYLIKNRPNHQREKLRITALDPADVDQIVGAYINKARQQPSIVYAHATRLFAFAMTSCHLDKSKFVTNVTRITEAALADSWARFGQMRGGSTGLSFWANFSDSVINTLILVPALNKIADLQRQTILKIIVNENLLDFLGYFVLYPLTTKDKTIIDSPYWQNNALEILHRFIPILREHMETAPIDRVNPLYDTWNKTAQSLQHHKVMNKHISDRGKDYIYTWEETWEQIGEAIGRYTLQCGYPRCPAPEETGHLQCAGCFDKCYCSLRCQQAHWNDSVNPHRLECVK